MGKGGQSSADQINKTTNTNTVADNGAVAIGQGGNYQTTSANVGVADTVITGAGNINNTGMYLGEGSSYSFMGLDDNSYNLLDQAQTLQYRGTENILSLMAAQAGAEKGTIQRADLSKPSDQAATAGGLKTVVTIVIVVLVGYLIFGRRKKK